MTYKGRWRRCCILADLKPATVLRAFMWRYQRIRFRFQVLFSWFYLVCLLTQDGRPRDKYCTSPSISVVKQLQVQYKYIPRQCWYSEMGLVYEHLYSYKYRHSIMWYYSKKLHCVKVSKFWPTHHSQHTRTCQNHVTLVHDCSRRTLSESLDEIRTEPTKSHLESLLWKAGGWHWSGIESVISILW